MDTSNVCSLFDKSELLILVGGFCIIRWCSLAGIIRAVFSPASVLQFALSSVDLARFKTSMLGYHQVLRITFLPSQCSSLPLPCSATASHWALAPSCSPTSQASLFRGGAPASLASLRLPELDITKFRTIEIVRSIIKSSFRFTCGVSVSHLILT